MTRPEMGPSEFADMVEKEVGEMPHVGNIYLGEGENLYKTEEGKDVARAWFSWLPREVFEQIPPANQRGLIYAISEVVVCMQKQIDTLRKEAGNEGD